MSDLFESQQGSPEEADDTLPFEAALKQLEEAVEQLEAGDLSLTDALRLFEEGLKASNVCHARLEEAKQKVEALVARNDGTFRLRDLDLGEEEAS